MNFLIYYLSELSLLFPQFFMSLNLSANYKVFLSNQYFLLKKLMNNMEKKAMKAQQDQMGQIKTNIRKSNVKLRIDITKRLEIQKIILAKENAQIDCNNETQLCYGETSLKNAQISKLQKNIFSEKMPLGLTNSKQMEIGKQFEYLSLNEENLSKQINHREICISNPIKKKNPLKLEEVVAIISEDNNFYLEKIESNIKSSFQNLKKLDKHRLELAHALKESIMQIEEEEKLCQILENTLKKTELKLKERINVKQEMDAKYLIDKFELCIIKLQSTNTLYRYGAKNFNSSITKEKLFFQRFKYMKWEAKLKNIDILDLKVFIITTLYPLCGLIFNDFSSQSNVYKVMYGLNFFLTEEEIESSFLALNSRIKKYCIEKKYLTLKNCLQSANLRKRRIIFICSEERFQQIMSKIIQELKSFKNKLINMQDVQLENTDALNGETVVSNKKLIIRYAYQEFSMKVAVDVQFCNVSNVSKQQIQSLRMKTQKYQPVLCWFQIPKIETNEKMKIYQEINQVLAKIKIFSRAS